METMKGLNTKESTLDEGQLKVLISGQLLFRDKTFEEATKNPNWRNKYKLSINEHSQWLEWAVNTLTSKYHMESRLKRSSISTPF